MSTPFHKSKAPPSALSIRWASSVRLTPAQISLLRRAFANDTEIFIEQAFHSGYSGASVYLVAKGDLAPVVVKMAHPVDLQHESDAYEKFVREFLPQHASQLKGEMLTSVADQLGLLVYTFAGGNLQTGATNLAGYYETHSGAATAEVIERLFRENGQYWWANHQLKRLVMDAVYDRLLPVHLQLTLLTGTAPPADSVTLESGEIDIVQVRTLQPGQRVLLHGFKVIKVRSGLLTLQETMGEGMQEPQLRVRVEGALPPTYQPGDPFGPHYARVKATRAILLTEAAQQAMPHSDLSGEEFVYNQCTYPNPLRRLDGLLSYPYFARVSITHGDLNLQNILVDSATGFAWLIDFGETGYNPALFDLQRLEVQVLTKLLLPCLRTGKLDPACVITLLEALHRRSPDTHAPLPALQEPYTVLVTLRQLASDYLVDKRTLAEYYRGLTLVLLGALKYDELDHTARAVAFLGAAAALRLVDTPLPPPTHKAPPSLGRRLRRLLIVFVAFALGVNMLPSLAARQTQPRTTPEPTTIPTPISITITIEAKDGANKRTGPDTDYASLGLAKPGEKFTAIGRDQSGEWLLIDDPDGQTWVSASTISDSPASLNVLPIVRVPTIKPTPPLPMETLTPEAPITIILAPEATLTPTLTATATSETSLTPTFTETATPQPQITATLAATAMLEPSLTPTFTETATLQPTIPATLAATVMLEPSLTPTFTETATLQPSITTTLTATLTTNLSLTPTPTITATLEPSLTFTFLEGAIARQGVGTGLLAKRLLGFISLAPFALSLVNKSEQHEYPFPSRQSLD